MIERKDMVRVWVEVDLNKVRNNFRKIREGAAPAQVLAVLKANAYGLGVEPVAECLTQEGAAGFCAATLEEVHQALTHPAVSSQKRPEHPIQ